jgi:hypothetical protein
VQQIRALFFGEELPEDFQDVVTEYYRSASNGSTSSARVVSFHYKVTNLYARSKKLVPHVISRFTEILDLLEEGEALAESMSGWSEEEEGWQAMRVTLPRKSDSTQHWAPHKTHTKYYYSSIFVYVRIPSDLYEKDISPFHNYLLLML